MEHRRGSGRYQSFKVPQREARSCLTFPASLGRQAPSFHPPQPDNALALRCMHSTHRSDFTQAASQQPLPPAQTAIYSQAGVERGNFTHPRGQGSARRLLVVIPD